jgi:hypothetical protein
MGKSHEGILLLQICISPSDCPCGNIHQSEVNSSFLRFQVFMEMETQLVVFWVTERSCSLVGGHRSFGGIYCLHLQDLRKDGSSTDLRNVGIRI